MAISSSLGSLSRGFEWSSVHDGCRLPACCDASARSPARPNPHDSRYSRSPDHGEIKATGAAEQRHLRRSVWFASWQCSSSSPTHSRSNSFGEHPRICIPHIEGGAPWGQTLWCSRITTQLLSRLVRHWNNIPYPYLVPGEAVVMGWLTWGTV